MTGVEKPQSTVIRYLELEIVVVWTVCCTNKRRGGQVGIDRICSRWLRCAVACRTIWSSSNRHNYKVSVYLPTQKAAPPRAVGLLALESFGV